MLCQASRGCTGDMESTQQSALQRVIIESPSNSTLPPQADVSDREKARSASEVRLNYRE